MPKLNPYVRSKQKDNRGLHAKVCARPRCGKTFVGIEIKKYCSKACLEMEWRKTHPDRRKTSEKPVITHRGYPPFWKCPCRECRRAAEAARLGNVERVYLTDERTRERVLRNYHKKAAS